VNNELKILLIVA